MKTERQHREELMDFARDVLEVFRAQREYFDEGRTKAALKKARHLETRLEHIAKAHVERGYIAGGLFDAVDEPEPAAAELRELAEDYLAMRKAQAAFFAVSKQAGAEATNLRVASKVKEANLKSKSEAILLPPEAYR